MQQTESGEHFRLDLNGRESPRAFLRAVSALATVPGWRIDALALSAVGAKAAASGAGRVARLARAIQALPADDASELLQAIAEIMRPMTAREMEKALMQTDLGATARKALVASLKRFEIVAVVPK